MTQGPANAHKMRLSHKLSQRPGTHAIRERSMREWVASGRGHMQAPIGFRASGISWIRPNFTASGAPNKDPSSDTENGNTEHRSGHSDRRRLTLGTPSARLRAKRHPSRNSKAPHVILCEPPARRRNLTVGSSSRQPRLGYLPTRRGLFLLFDPPGASPRTGILVLLCPQRGIADRNAPPCPAPTFSHRQRRFGGYAAAVNGR